MISEEKVGESRSIDQFEVLRELGRGGTSVVYLVREKESGARFAMKTVPEGSAEAEVLAALSSAADSGQTGIPAYFGKVVHGGNTAGFLMEYVEGETLQKLLEDGRVFTVREAAEAGVQLCDILARLHAMDPPRIYRDLKPGNVIVRQDGRYVLVDYGAVRTFREGVFRDTHPLGTEGYAAPEQYGGWEQSDERTDIYGIGAVLHHMLTGRSPLETGLRPLTEIAQMEYEAQESGQYAKMAKILLRCCSVAPSMRFSSCRELKKALQGLRKEAGSEEKNSKEKAWRRFVALAYASFALLIGSGLFGATASGAEMGRYRQIIREAETKSSPAEMEEAFRQAVNRRPRDPQAYIAFMRTLAKDNVVTHEEKERLECFLYENGYPDQMREWKPPDYAGLEMELGKLYLVSCEGETEAARRAFENVASTAGARAVDREFARAMCAVLSDCWTKERLEAWTFLIQESTGEAMRTGDGRLAASICGRAAGELALFHDRFAEAGADSAVMREVAEEVEKFVGALENGWPAAPENLVEQARTAAEAAERTMEYY